jgi:hypothetical protein
MEIEMKKVILLMTIFLLYLNFTPTIVNSEDEPNTGCGGVNRIEVNDPPEQKGGPNDLKRVTLEIFRSKDFEGRQTRKIEITMEVHSKFFAESPEVCAFQFSLKLTDTEGKVGIFQQSYLIQNSSGNNVFRITSPSLIDDFERAYNIKFSCANIQFIVGTFNTETKIFKQTDETDWSEQQVDFSNTTQPPNPTNLRSENDVGCLKLIWDKPPKTTLNLEIIEYRIYRDNELIGKVPATTLYFKDCNVEADKTYKYGICAVSAWLVEGPKSPLSVTYIPAAKIVPEKDTIDLGSSEIDKFIPIKLKITNYGDLDVNLKFELSDDWFSVSPENITVEKTKRVEIEIALNKDKVIPNNSYEGSIKITWGTSDFQMIYVAARTKNDTTPPEFTIDALNEVTNQTQYIVKGTVEPGSTVWVNNVSAIVDEDKFTATIIILPAPSVTNIEVRASDKYNNTVKKVVGKIINILNSNVVLVIGSETMTVNEKEMPIKPAPLIISGRTLVPLRAVADAFGAQVSWDANTRTATIVLRDKTILITLDKDTAIINGEPKKIGSKAMVISGRTMVPFRFIAEAFGAQVDYNAETKTITLALTIRP